MTEKQWLKCQDAEKLLGCLVDQFSVDIDSKATSRRLHLFACACVHRVQELLPKGYMDFFALVEQNVDKPVNRRRMQVAVERAEQIAASKEDTIIFAMTYGDYGLLGYGAAELLASKINQPHTSSFNRARREEQGYQTTLFRDIFANPFRPINVMSSWFTPTVTSLAKAIYQDRAFESLPLLADALEEAGCTNAELLAHCRGPEPHVRGCWVIDRLTGRD